MLNKNQAASKAKRIELIIKTNIDQFLKEQDFDPSFSFFKFGDDGMYYLSKVINKDRNKLNLNNQNVTMIGIGYLQMAEVPSLRCINLGNNQIGNIGVKLLTRCRWIHLQKLIINNCSLDGSGVTHLSKGRWPNLRFIQLSNNRIEGGVDRLTRGNWKKISQLCFQKSDDNDIQFEANFKIEEVMTLTLSCWRSLNVLKIILKDFKMDYTAQSRRIAIYMKFREIEKLKNVMKATFPKLMNISIKHG